MLTDKDIKTWLAKDARIDVSKVDNDTPLFSGGILDSFEMVELVGLIEEKTGRLMPALEVTPENIDTINRVLAWLARAEARSA